MYKNFPSVRYSIRLVKLSLPISCTTEAMEKTTVGVEYWYPVIAPLRNKPFMTTMEEGYSSWPLKCWTSLRATSSYTFSHMQSFTQNAKGFKHFQAIFQRCKHTIRQSQLTLQNFSFSWQYWQAYSDSLNELRLTTYTWQHDASIAYACTKAYNKMVTCAYRVRMSEKIFFC